MQSNSIGVNTTPVGHQPASPLAAGLDALINAYFPDSPTQSSNTTQMLDVACRQLDASPDVEIQFLDEFRALLDSNMNSASLQEVELMRDFHSSRMLKITEARLRLALSEFNSSLDAPNKNVATLLDHARQYVSTNPASGDSATQRLLIKLETMLRETDIKEVRQLLSEFLKPIVLPRFKDLGNPALLNLSKMGFAFNFQENVPSKLGFIKFDEFKELSLSPGLDPLKKTAREILKNLEEAGRSDLIGPVYRQVTLNIINTIGDLNALNEEVGPEVFKQSARATDERRQFITSSNIKNAYKAKLLIELIDKCAPYYESSECKPSAITITFKECMTDLGAILQELYGSSDEDPNLDIERLKSAINDGLGVAVNYLDEKLEIGSELLAWIIKESNDKAKHIGDFFKLVERAFDDRVRGGRVFLTPMAQKLIELNAPPGIAGKLYFGSGYKALFERAIDSADGLREMKNNKDADLKIDDTVDLLIALIRRSSDQEYAEAALELLKDGLVAYSGAKVKGRLEISPEYLQKAFDTILEKIKFKLFPEPGVIGALPINYSSSRKILWLGNKFPEFPKPPQFPTPLEAPKFRENPELDIFNVTPDVDAMMLHNDHLYTLPAQDELENPGDFASEEHNGMTSNIPFQWEDTPTEKLLERKRERSESSDSHRSQP